MDTYRYTAFFCEENIWWLTHELSGRPAPWSCLEVWVLSNPGGQILVAEQRAAGVGAMLVWDYHVVLRARDGGSDRVFDFDTRLPFPVEAPTYLARTFPEPRAIPGHLRAQVRVIPADDYLAHFSSDRSHMRGRLPASKFPDDPPILSDEAPVKLSEYVDMRRQIPGTRLMGVPELLAEIVGAIGEA